MILPKVRKFAAMKGVGARIVPTSLRSVTKNKMKRKESHCISKGMSNTGLMLDHSRALQPKISRIPAKTTVGSSHHMRNLMA